MKVVRFAVIASLLVSNAALAATPAEIAALKAQSQGAVAAKETSNQQQILQLKGEVDSLQNQISNLGKQIKRDKTIRDITLVVSAPLLIMAGIQVVDMTKETGDWADLAQLWEGGIAAIVGVPGIVAGGVGIYKVYRINIQQNELPALSQRLGHVQQQLDAATAK